MKLRITGTLLLCLRVLPLTSLPQNPDQLFNATLYSQAASLYQETCATDSHARYQLALCHLLNGCYAETLSALAQGGPPHPDENYICGLACKGLGQIPQAIVALQRYLSAPNPLFADEAREALGNALLHQGCLLEASSQFATLAHSSKQPQMQVRAFLGLFQVAYRMGDDQQATEIIHYLQDVLPPEDALRPLVAYLDGVLADQVGDLSRALAALEHAVPQHPSLYLEEWQKDALYRLGRNYARYGEDVDLPVEARREALIKAEEYFRRLASSCDPNEPLLLALGHSLLVRSQLTQDLEAYQHAQALFVEFGHCLSAKGREEALHLQAKYAPSYALRDQLYRYLTQENHQTATRYGESWYQRGFNDFSEGIVLCSQKQDEEGMQAFDRSAFSFQNAYATLKEEDPLQAALSLKCQAQALHASGDLERSKEALALLNQIVRDASLLKALQHPDEIYYLRALIALEIAEVEHVLDGESFPEASLKEGLSHFPQGEWADRELYLLGILHLRKKNFEEAEKSLLEVSHRYPQSEVAGEALFFAGRAAESQQAESRKRQHFTQLIERYPHSRYASEAYFSYYAYQDYVQGDRAALKHLDQLPKKYPDSPYSLHAWYLMGLDYKRDRKTPEGKWLRKKNLPAAIEAFAQLEDAFDRLSPIDKLSQEEIDKLTALRYRSMLERALTNFQVAEESQGMKREMFLVYAEELLQKLQGAIQHPHSESCRPIEEESGYWLVKIKMAQGKEAEAESAIAGMLEKYRSAKISRGYFLSRLLYEWALLGANHQDHRIALERLKLSEEASKGNVLGSDQLIDLWIQQSRCYCALEEYDQALLILSQAINEDTVSGLRLKAMALRAEVYEQQGRRELARRQWEALEKKGGIWAAQAKQQLIENYGYPANHFE